MGAGARAGRRRYRGVPVAVILMIAASMPLGAQAVHFWTIGTSTSSLAQHVTTDVTLTIQNTSTKNGTGSDAIGCIRIAIPDAYDVVSVTIDSVSRGLIWDRAASGSPTTYVTFSAADDGKPLLGDPEFDILTATIRITGQTVGTWDWTATDYEKADCTKLLDTRTLPMQVTAGSNLAPTAVADGYSVVAGTSLDVAAAGVLDNDSDPENDPLYATLVTDAGSGTLALAADGGFTYDPDPGFAGTDTFTYEATDLSDPSAPATVTIDVTNVAPATTADSYPASKNRQLTVPAASGLLANDTDPDTAAGQPLTAVLESAPATGVLSPAADGSFTYDPAPGATGPVTFTYRAFDGVVSSAPETVTITISDDPPDAADDAYSSHMGTPIVAPPADRLTANDSDVNGDGLTVDTTPVSPPTFGILVLGADGSFTYSPPLLWTGTDSFTYRVSDGTTWSTATVTISVSNGQPIAMDDAVSTSHDRAASGNVLANDLDPDGDSLTSALVTGPTYGTLSGGGIAADGGFTYTPNPGYVGPDSFTYEASDGKATSAAATVTIDVTNAAPAASDHHWTVVHDRSRVVAAPGVLAGATDPDGDTLTANLLAGPTKGTLSGGGIAATGGFTYTPQPGFVGTDSFTYDVSDGFTTGSATVTITVTDIAPSADDDRFEVGHGEVLTVAAPGVLANDSDADGDTLAARLVSAPSHGTLSLAANGRIRYEPDAGYAGPDSFSYGASDGVASSTATVHIDVRNAAPTAVGDRYEVTGDVEALVRPASGVLANDLDADGDPLAATLDTGPRHGEVLMGAAGGFAYRPESGYVGLDSFSYTVSDGFAASEPATVVLSIVAPPTPGPTPDQTPDPAPTPDPSVAPTPRPSTDPPGPGSGGEPPTATWSIGGDPTGGSGGDDRTHLPIANLASSTLGLFGRAFDWLVPGALVTVPGLLLSAAITAQMFGALAWLPLVRRKIGGFGFGQVASAGVGQAR